MVRTPSSRHVVTAALIVVFGCSEPEHPSYTRLREPAPRVEDMPAGLVLVVFWATWCPPCVEELPSLRALARAPPAGLTVVTLGEDEDDGPVREVLGEPPPRELGYRRDVGRGAATAFRVEALPSAFLVADGQLVARFSGPRDWDSRGMRRLLAKLASEASESVPVGSRPGVDGRRGDR